MSPFDHMISGALQDTRHDHRYVAREHAGVRRPVSDYISRGTFHAVSAIEQALHRVRYL